MASIGDSAAQVRARIADARGKDGDRLFARGTERVWIAGILLVAGLIPFTLAGMMWDDRLHNGVSIWIKPLKFQIATVTYLLTLFLVARLLDEAVRAGWLLRLTALAAFVTAGFEILYISGQALRGRASHFNSETAFEAAMYGLMGTFAVVLIACALVIAAMIALRAKPSVGLGVRGGSALGLSLGFLATLLVASHLGESGGPWIGGERSDVNGLFFFGWSTTGGDLRVSHFFATHMMQALPLLGLALDRSGARPAVAVSGVAVGAILWGGLIAGTFQQALNGAPFIPL